MGNGGGGHHCACGVPFSNVCTKKGHMVECSKHRGKFHIPGDECISCGTERRNAELRAKAAREAANKKAASTTKKGKK